MRFYLAICRALTPIVLALTLAAIPAATDTRTIPASEYQSRRAAIARKIGPDAIFIAFSSQPARRTGDVDWPFRQNDNLLYLTGLNAPDTTLLLIPGERDRAEVIFTREPNPAMERWTGPISRHDEVTATSGVRHVEAAGRFDTFLDALLQGTPLRGNRPGDYYNPPVAPSVLEAFRAGRTEMWLLLDERGNRTTLTREQQFATHLRRRYPDLRIRDASPLLLAMREIKSDREIALIQRAVDITVDAQKAAMARALTATRENEVQATIEFTFRNSGACCPAFPSIVAAGPNATILHYEANDDLILRDGLLLTDIGAEVHGYSADVTRTYPADGTFSVDQRAIYDIVLAAQNETLPLMRPGHRFIEIHDRAQEVVGRGLLKLGLVTKNTPAQSELYLFHGPGHPLGLQTHDVYDRQRSFEPSMVFTNEPGVYVRKNDVVASDVFKTLSAAEQLSIQRALDRYDTIGVRIEDDILITAADPEVMSAAAPRTPADIEHWMAGAKK